jgi:uncharacterized protein YjbI with pentapeptide repeats
MLLRPRLRRLTRQEYETLTPKDRAELLNARRQNRLQRISALGLVFGFIFTAGSLYYTARTLQSSQEAQITDRFTKAMEQLDSDSVGGRLGAIYSLARVANDSPKDRDAIYQVLAVYIREHSSREAGKESTSFPSDIRAALQVMSGKGPNYGLETIDVFGLRIPYTPDAETSDCPARRIDLVGIRIPRSDLSGSCLMHADLRDADLTRANLREANMVGVKLGDSVSESARSTDTEQGPDGPKGAVLAGADLRGADLSIADLRSADLSDANLRQVGDDSWVRLCDANLRGADLQGADLIGVEAVGADMRGADLRGANISDPDPENPDRTQAWTDLTGVDLRKADLRNAILRGVDLSGARVDGADLRGADLRDANLSATPLGDASGVEVEDETGTYIDPCARPESWRPRVASFVGADLRGADLRGAKGLPPLDRLRRTAKVDDQTKFS